MTSSYHQNLDATFASHFVTLRTALGLTQAALAAQLGVTERAIQRWEAGTRSPKADSLKLFLELCIRHHAFPMGYEVEQARTLWKAAHLKVLFDEHWVLSLLDEKQVPVKTSDRALMSHSIEQRLDWGEEVAEVSFYGRENEQAQLITWIQEDRCRLIALLGMGGIGKSSLAVKLMHQLASSVNVAVFRSVRDAIPCEELVADLIQALAPEPITNISSILERRITLLLELLQTRRCLVVLDNIETLFQEGEQSGQYRVGYEGYGRLLERIGTTQHQSCLLLTSREKPAELKPLEGNRAPVRSLHLAGLDQEAGEQILLEKHLRGDAEARQQLIDAYSGNPLAIKIVAETIRDLFASEIGEFLAEGHLIFQGVRALLAQQFARLTFLEQSVLRWLAIVREQTDVTRLLSLFVTPVSRLSLLEALEDLRRRSLVEHGEQRTLFTLQSVVMEYVTNDLITRMARDVQHLEHDVLFRYALSLASAKTYIQQTQERLLLAPVLFHLGVGEHRKGVVEHHLLHYLDHIRSLDLNTHGYGPTNIAMLLRQLNGHLKGVNLSACGLREANLQMQMRDAQLVASTVQDSVFIELFSSGTAIAISRDRKHWAAANSRGDVRVWKWGKEENQTLHLAWRAHITNIFTLAFSLDGRTLASGGWDNTVKLWEVESGTLLWTGWHTGQVNKIAFAPDGHLLASGGDDNLIRLWDTQSGTQIQQLAGQGATVHSLDWSSDGKLASGHTDGSIWIWEPEMPEPGIHRRLSEHASWVTGLAFSPDGTWLASASFDSTVKLWKMESDNSLQTFFGHKDRVMCLAWSPDGRTVASGDWDGTIFLWDIVQGRARASLRAAGESTMIGSIAFTPDSRTLLSASTFLQMWDVERGQCLRTINSYFDAFTSIDWSPDGRFLAAGGTSRHLTIWEIAPVPSQNALYGHRDTVQGVAWSPDGRLVASAGNDGRIGLWNSITGICLEMLQDPDTVDILFLSVAWSPDSHQLACGSFLLGVQVWDISAHTRRWVRQTPHPTRIHSMAWSPDGTKLAGAGWDGFVYLWDPSDGTLLRQMVGHTWGVMSVAWSPDGKWLASAGGGREHGEVIVWEAESGEQVRVLVGHPWATFAVAWSPDGKKLVSGGSDGMLCWWEVDSGQRIQVQKAHQGIVYMLKVSPDGQRLASCGDDGAILLWNFESGEQLQTLRLERPYERLDISGIQGISEAQKATLRTLGAVEN